MGYKNKADELAYHAAYRAAHRIELRDRARADRKAHPEVEKKWRAKYVVQKSPEIKIRKAKLYLKTKEKCNEQSRRSYFLRKYGITPEQKIEMMNAQDNKCAICGDSITFRTGHTDHRHEPFQLREILCRYCNPGIGNFKEDPIRLEKAAAYLRKHSTI